MRITTDFTRIPDEYAKAAPAANKLDGQPIVSFPFYIDQLDPSAHYLHWALTDPDSIPVCGFEWIHWSVANLPVDALMYDFNDAHALAIPADFSRTMVSMIPEALQGRNSEASRFVGKTDPAVIARYVGPTPPDKDHDYLLRVWATAEPLEGLDQGFWLNEQFHALLKAGAGDPAWMLLTGAC
jgi:Raf kinase inhibitor-like YbhB/YbcL family protein